MPVADVTVGGYLETYYALNFATPSNHITALRGFDDRDRTFTLSNVALDVKGVRDALTARVIVQFGSTAATYYASDPEHELWRFIQQATLAYVVAPVTVEAGLFPSPIGPEVIPIKDNWNWSRSDLFYGLPFYHTGARASVPLGSGWTAMLHVYNGWNSVVDNNSSPSVAASASYASKSVNGQVLYFGGIERDRWRHLFDAYATVSVTDELSVMAQLDGGVESGSGWIAGAAYGKLQLSDTLYVAARGDYFREYVADGAMPIFWPTAWIASATGTLALQPAEGLSVRLEARHDHAPDDVFFGGTVMGDGVTTPYVPNREAQNTVTLGAVAWF